jgi:uncharacterized membrane protein YphA (DoxX/SURF4 family)
MLLKLNEKYPVLILRILMGIIFITHGAARLYYWSIPDFAGLPTKAYRLGCSSPGLLPLAS